MLDVDLPAAPESLTIDFAPIRNSGFQKANAARAGASSSRATVTASWQGPLRFRFWARHIEPKNTNPLARYALMAQGEQVHVSCWPPIWPTRPPSIGGNFNNVAANRIRASAHSFEAKAFGIVTAGFMDKRMRDELVARDPKAADVLDATPRAASFVIDPTGEPISETLQDEEGIVYAQIDISQCVEPKQFHDVVGYYNRFDIFELTVRRTRQRPARFLTDEAPANAIPLQQQDRPGDGIAFADSSFQDNRAVNSGALPTGDRPDA